LYHGLHESVQYSGRNQIELRGIYIGLVALGLLNSHVG
jgi:hypothetical protein